LGIKKLCKEKEASRKREGRQEGSWPQRGMGLTDPRDRFAEGKNDSAVREGKEGTRKRGE